MRQQRIETDISIFRLNTRSREPWEVIFNEPTTAYAALWICLYWQTIGVMVSFSAQSILYFHEEIVMDQSSNNYLGTGINRLLASGKLAQKRGTLHPTAKFLELLRALIGNPDPSAIILTGHRS